MTRLAAVLTVLALAVPAGALAQENPFGPLPPPAPEPTPQPVNPADTVDDGGDVSREMLFGVGGALLVVFLAIGWFITRDARRTLPEDRRRDEPRLREEGPHRYERKAKQKARQKGRQQRKARKTTRRRAR